MTEAPPPMSPPRPHHIIKFPCILLFLIFTLKSEFIPPAFQLCRFPAKSDSTIILLLSRRILLQNFILERFFTTFKGTVSRHGYFLKGFQGVHALLSLYLPSQAKLWCTLQLRWQIPSTIHIFLLSPVLLCALDDLGITSYTYMSPFPFHSPLFYGSKLIPNFGPL